MFPKLWKKKISFRFQTLYQKFVPAVNVCVKRRTIDTLSVFTADTMAIEAFLQWIDVMVKFNVQEIVPLLQTHDSFSSTFELVATTKIKKWRAGGAKQWSDVKCGSRRRNNTLGVVAKLVLARAIALPFIRTVGRMNSLNGKPEVIFVSHMIQYIYILLSFGCNEY